MKEIIRSVQSKRRHRPLFFVTFLFSRYEKERFAIFPSTTPSESRVPGSGSPKERSPCRLFWFLFIQKRRLSLANTLVVVSWGERRHNPFLWIVNQTLASASSGVSRPINRSAIYRQETTTCVRQARESLIFLSSPTNVSSLGD